MEARGRGGGSMIQGSVRVDGDGSTHGNPGASKVEVEEEADAA